MNKFKLELLAIAIAFIFPSLILCFIPVTNLKLALLQGGLSSVTAGGYLVITKKSFKQLGLQLNWQSLTDILPGTIIIAVIQVLLLIVLPYLSGSPRSFYWQINLFWYFYLTVFQEVIWRGFAHLLLTKIFSQPKVIIIISAALFALAHFYFKSLLIILGSFCLGLFWASNYYKYRSIIDTVISHYFLGLSVIAFNYMGIKSNWSLF